MENLDDAFSKLSQSLDTSFVDQTSAIKNEVQEFTNETKELANVSINTLEDKQYIQDGIKKTLEMGTSVLEKLKSDIKVGSNPRMYEVFSKMMDSMNRGFQELRDLNKTVVDLQIFNDGPIENAPAKVEIKMTGKELLDFIEKTKKESELNRVDADFEVEDEKKKN